MALLSGCTVGPSYSPPSISTPGRFAEAPASRAVKDTELATWWRRFGDPRLAELINMALAQNLDVQSAAARIREARAREMVAGAVDRPQVDAQASATRQRISENAIPLPPGASGGPSQSVGGSSAVAFGLPGSEFNSFRVGFDASWEIDLFGKGRRSVEAAKARFAEAVWNRRDMQVTAAGEVANAYFTLRELQARIGTAERELARQERMERLVAAQVKGGLVSGLDLEQQRSDRASAAAAISPLQAQANAEVHALGILTGQTPEALTAALSNPGPLPDAGEVPPPGIPSELLRRRPDIRAAERELAAATADIGVAVADLYPQFSLTAAPALVSTALATLLNWGSRTYSLGASFDWPIVNGGRTRGNIAIANARQQEALITYRKTVLGALQDVEDTLARTDSDHEELARLQQALSNARRAEAIARSRYSGGLVTYSDVLQAQARTLKLDSELMELKGTLARDTAALFKALGGGWPELAQGVTQP
ncbi:MAG TPA: efflux transporter outer membrane subunit [Sphingomicrobium sp.]|nr:efflux transporter outer membrane subunit [Sphingomicrobium sp.]